MDEAADLAREFLGLAEELGSRDDDASVLLAALVTATPRDRMFHSNLRRDLERRAIAHSHRGSGSCTTSGVSPTIKRYPRTIVTLIGNAIGGRPKEMSNWWSRSCCAYLKRFRRQQHRSTTVAVGERGRDGT